MQRTALLAAVLSAVLTACGTSYDLSAATTVDELDTALAESSIDYDTVTVFDPAKDPGDIVSVDGLPDGTTLESVPDGTTGITVTVVDNSEYEVPDVIGLDPDDARDTYEELLGDLAPAIRIRPVFELDMPLDEISSIEIDDETYEPGDIAPLVRETINLVYAGRKDLGGEYVLRAPHRNFEARPEPTADGGTSTSWSNRGSNWEGAYCAGTGGYSDIREGFNLTLRDADGTVVSTASLEEGAAVDRSSGSNNAYDCRFEFTFPDVPPSEFYEITSNRGSLTYDFGDVRREEDPFSLVLGDG